MAVLAIAGVGAAIGAGIGIGFDLGLTGILTAASIGFSIGTMAGNMLFPEAGPQVHNEGARLGDLKVTASTYGTVIPFGWGKTRISGNCIWAKQIQEHQNVTHQGGGHGKGTGGKGGGSVTTTTFTYTLSFAVGLCRGSVDAILRIWMNGNLVYDVTTGQDVVKRAGLVFRFYSGSETQLPDSLIEADQGTGNVPAFRGLSYVVFEDLELTDFGSRMPNVTIEIARVAQFQENVAQLTPASPSTLGAYSNQAIAINPLSLRGYIWGKTPTGLIEFNLQTMVVLQERMLGDVIGDSSYNTMLLINNYNHLVIGYDQMLYAMLGTEVAKIIPSSLAMVSKTTAPSTFGNNIDLAVPIGLLGQDGVQSYLLVRNRVLQGDLYVLDTSSMEFIETVHPTGSSNFVGGGALALGIGVPSQGEGECWMISADSGSAVANLYIDRVVLSLEADVDLTGGYTIKTVVTVVNEAVILAATIDPTADGWYATFLTGAEIVFDETDKGLLIKAPMYYGGSQKLWLLKWTQEAGVLWKVNTGYRNSGVAANFNKISGGTFTRFFQDTSVNHMRQFNVATGVISLSHDWVSSTLPDPNGPQAYWSEGASLVGSSGSGWAKWNTNALAAAGTTLDEIFLGICLEAGLDEADVNVLAIESIAVVGYTVSQRAAAADCLRPLANVFLVDAIESDYAIRFQPRGVAEVATLIEDEMIRADGQDSTGEPYIGRRLDEAVLPSKVSVTYTDNLGDYGTGTQVKQRIKQPTPTHYSSQQIDIQVGAVLDTDTARQQAEKILFSNWIGRDQWDTLLPPKFAWLDPSDVVTMTLNSGVVARARLGPTQLGVDFSTQVTLTSEVDTQYVSTVTGATSEGVLPQSIGIVMPSALFLLDVPLLRDVDDIYAQGFRAYWAAAGYGLTGWRGALLQESKDAVSWGDAGSTIIESAWGYTETVLADRVSVFHTLFEDTLIVSMMTGGSSLETVTETQMANGFNAAAVFKSNGEIEIIQFLEVEDLGNGRYQLTGLNRGMRGTDTMAQGHAAGEQFLVFGSAGTNGLVVPINMLSQRDYYRAATINTVPQAALTEIHRWRGRDKMPWAPVHVQAAFSGSPQDILITWERRNRTNAGLHDSDGDIPMSEESEAYQIDIYDTDGETVLRNLTSTTASVTYTASQIATDFGSPAPSPLFVAVYQMSATVGRGFGRIDELEVA